jgi:hypothetical protein
MERIMLEDKECKPKHYLLTPMSGVVNAGGSSQLNFIVSRITRTSLFNEETGNRNVKDEAPNTHPMWPDQVKAYTT